MGWDICHAWLGNKGIERASTTFLLGRRFCRRAQRRKAQLPNTHRVGVERPGKAPKLIGSGSMKFCVAVSGEHSARYGHHLYIIEEINDPDAGPPASWTK